MASLNNIETQLNTVITLLEDIKTNTTPAAPEENNENTENGGN